ncbi:hypothetical protein ScPMuIL_011402 [Solemya velum]
MNIYGISFGELMFVNIIQCHVMIISQASKISYASLVPCKKQQFLYSSLRHGKAICRKCSVCLPGQYVISNCTENSDVVCGECPKGTYSRAGTVCNKCTSCSKTEYEFTSCAVESDTVCAECPRGEYAARRGCRKCSYCVPGYYVKTKCSTTSDTICAPCPPYTYSTKSNTPRCLPCRPCRHFEKVLKMCNSTMDIVCGDCRREFYRDTLTGKCLKCSECYTEYEDINQRISECEEKSSDPNRVCMPIFPPPYRQENETTVHVPLNTSDYDVTDGITLLPTILLLTGVSCALLVIAVVTLYFIKIKNMSTDQKQPRVINMNIRKSINIDSSTDTYPQEYLRDDSSVKKVRIETNSDRKTKEGEQPSVQSNESVCNDPAMKTTSSALEQLLKGVDNENETEVVQMRILQPDEQTSIQSNEDVFIDSEMKTTSVAIEQLSDDLGNQNETNVVQMGGMQLQYSPLFSSPQSRYSTTAVPVTYDLDGVVCTVGHHNFGYDGCTSFRSVSCDIFYESAL